MPRQISIARRNLLKGAAALTAGIALQRRHLAGAQDASPTAEPEEVTYSQPVEGKTNVSWWTYQQPVLGRRQHRDDQAPSRRPTRTSTSSISIFRMTS